MNKRNYRQFRKWSIRTAQHKQQDLTNGRAKEESNAQSASPEQWQTERGQQVPHEEEKVPEGSRAWSGTSVQ